MLEAVKSFEITELFFQQGSVVLLSSVLTFKGNRNISSDCSMKSVCQRSEIM